MQKVKLNKKNVLIITIKFLVLMLLLTLLSRALHGITIAEVTIAQAGEKRITHETESTGEIYAKKEIPIIVKEGILISSVNVGKGENMRKGDTLFTLDMNDLRRLEKGKQREIDILDIQIKSEAAEDSLVRQDNIRSAQLYEELSEYKKLIKAKGLIISPVSGVVVKTKISSGDKTSGTADVLVSNVKAGLIITSQFSAEDETYFASSPTIEIQTSDGIDVAGASVLSVFRNAEEPKMLDVVFAIPEKGLQIGRTVSIKVSMPAERYSTCIPKAAVHQNGKSYYVNTIKEYDTVLGTELRVVQTEVVIPDQNEIYAAVEGLLANQSVIVSSSRALTENTRVRIVKNDEKN